MPPPQSSAWSEGELRDHLAAHLEIIEPGLQLVKTEYHLPNPRGAAGFIDILSRDENGDLVVIELKKSDQTARQALHELTKYVTLLADQRGIPPHQLRCYLVSTTWNELLVPFARFKAMSDFSASGLKLVCGPRGKPESTEPVDLPSVPTGVEPCPLHAMLMFSNPRARDEAVRELQNRAESIGLEDYFLLMCEYHADDFPTRTPYGIYLVMGVLEGQAAVRAEQAFLAEDEDATGEDEWFLEQSVQAELFTGLGAEDIEVSTPDRFMAERTRWPRSSHIGRGRYADEHVWPVERLEAVASAIGGRHASSFSRILRPNHRQNWSRGVSDLMDCLDRAPSWRTTIQALATEIEAHSDSEVRVGVFCPSDIVAALDYTFRTDNGSALPILRLQYRYSDIHRHVVGCLAWDGTVLSSIDDSLGEIYPNVEDFFIFPGIVDDSSTKLYDIHGLRHMLVEFSPGDTPPPNLLTVDESGDLRRQVFRDDDPPLLPISEFFEAHEEYLLQLAQAYDHYTWRLGIPRLNPGELEDGSDLDF